MKTGNTAASRMLTGQTGWKAEAGTEATGYGRASAASSVPTYGNNVVSSEASPHIWQKVC